MPDGGTSTAISIDSSDIQVTAMAIRALQAYAPKTQLATYRLAVQRAGDWLSATQPRTAEDRAFQLLRLAWTGRHKDAIRKAARELLAQQRTDGGWAQLSSLTSDAYGTGQSLFGLKEAGAIDIKDPAYQLRDLLLIDESDGRRIMVCEEPLYPDHALLRE